MYKSCDLSNQMRAVVTPVVTTCHKVCVLMCKNVKMIQIKVQ